MTIMLVSRLMDLGLMEPAASCQLQDPSLDWEPSFLPSLARIGPESLFVPLADHGNLHRLVSLAEAGRKLQELHESCGPTNQPRSRNLVTFWDP